MKGKSYSSTSVQTYYEEQLTRYSYALWGGEVLCFAPITLIFFLILPLCLKDGQSLGKFLMKVKVVDSRGFAISTSQKIIRPIIVTVIHLLALIPNATLGIMVYLAIAITSFFMMSLGKKRMNLLFGFYQMQIRFSGAIYILSVSLTSKVLYHSAKLRGCMFALRTTGE